MRRTAFAIPIVVLAGLSLALGGSAEGEPGGRPSRPSPSENARLFSSSFTRESKGEIDAALEDVLKILRATPRSYVGNLRAGWLHYLRGDYGRSMRFYERAKKLQPRSLEPGLGMLLPLTADKSWKKAEAVGLSLVSKAPTNYLARIRLAYVFFIQGKYGKAQAHYEVVVRYFPSDVDGMLGLAWTHLRQGHGAEARALFLQVLELRKDNPSALSGLEAL